MKKYTQYILLVFLTFFLASCNDFLSDAQPVDQFPIDEVFNSGDDLEAALIGAYDLIQQGEVMGSYLTAIADLMGHNAFGWNEDISALQLEADHWIPERIWIQAYKAINQVNAILAALPEVTLKDATFKPEFANQIEGEALFIRGLLYFELVRFFALPYGNDPSQSPGVPILLSPVLKKESIQFPARATVAQVYEQAAEDLEKSREKLPEMNESGRATRFAAIAYAARIAFQKEEYQRAADFAGEILERQDLFLLNPTPEEFYSNEGSAEEIWVIFSSAANDHIVNGLAEIFENAPITTDLKTKGYASVVPASQIADIYETDTTWRIVDLRCDPNGILSNDPIILGDTTLCYKYESGAIDTEDDTPNARLAEFILMQAEACVQTQGINLKSIELLNQIRRRSLRVIDDANRVVPESDSFIEFEIGDFPNAFALLEAIILERRVELAFEGNYFHDLMRRKTGIQKGQIFYPYDAPELRLPIPQREIDSNPNLVQNEGY